MAVATVSPAEAGVAVGDFFYTSWGYDQTNVDFYKVVGLTPKGVKVQKWAGKTICDDGGPITYAIPGDSPATVTDWSDPDNRQKPAPVKTKKLQSWGGPGSVYIRVADYASGRPWDGTPKYQTGAGWGH